jgi:hypothetical protein
LVIDGSASVGANDFELSKQFVGEVADRFTISPFDTRIGIVQFSSSSQEELSLSHGEDLANIHNALNVMTHIGEGTSTSAAIEFTSLNLFTNDRPNAKPVMIVLTDGQSGDFNVLPQAKAIAASHGITMMSVGVGSGIGLAELEAIADQDDYVFTMNDFNELLAAVDGFSTEVCEIINLLTASPSANPTASTSQPTRTPSLSPTDVSSESDDASFESDDVSSASDDVSAESDDDSSASDDVSSESDDASSDLDDDSSASDDVSTESGDVSSESDDAPSESVESSSDSGESSLDSDDASSESDDTSTESSDFTSDSDDDSVDIAPLPSVSPSVDFPTRSPSENFPTSSPSISTSIRPNPDEVVLDLVCSGLTEENTEDALDAIRKALLSFFEVEHCVASVVSHNLEGVVVEYEAIVRIKFHVFTKQEAADLNARIRKTSDEVIIDEASLGLLHAFIFEVDVKAVVKPSADAPATQSSSYSGIHWVIVASFLASLLMCASLFLQYYVDCYYCKSEKQAKDLENQIPSKRKPFSAEVLVVRDDFCPRNNSGADAFVTKIDTPKLHECGVIE